MSEASKSIQDVYTEYLKDPDLNGPKLLAKVQGFKDAWTRDRASQYDRIWKNNLAFYRGDHYIRDNGNAMSNPYRVRLRENHTNNILQRIISVIVQNLPIPRVFPNSVEWEDKQNAESSEEYLKYFHRKRQMELLYGKLIKYTCVFGNGFVTRNWNADLGGRMDLGASETKDGEPKKAYYHGDTEVFIDDPFKIAVRPGIDEWSDHFDMVRSIPTSRQMLEAKYGPIESEGARLYNPYTGKERLDEDQIIVDHYFHKPTSWFDTGLYVCWAGSKELKVSEYPYDDGELPTQHLAFDRPPMRLYGMSTIEQIMDLQEQLNRAASMIVESRNLMARPRVTVSHEAQVPATSLSDRPGEITRYRLAGGPPQFHVPNFNFGEMSAHKADVRNAMGMVSGVTTASRGEIPQAAKTALALQLVLEQDRSQFAPFIKLFHGVILQTSYGILGQAAQYIAPEDPRLIKIEKGLSVAKPFHGGMVPTPLDVYLEDTNPLGWTSTGRIENVVNLAQMGILTDKKQILEMIDLKSSDPAFESIKINTQAAQREIIELNKGVMLPIGPEDDDEIHLGEHIKIPAGYEFRALPKIVQEAHLQHIEQHKQRVTGGAQGPQAGPQVPGAPSGKPATRQLQNPEDVAMGLNPQPAGGLMEELLSRRG